MGLLLVFLALPFISLLVGLITAWRFTKNGNKVALGVAIFCTLLGFLYGIIIGREASNELYSIVFAMHGLIVIVLLKRSSVSLPILWLLWTLVGGLLLELLFSQLFQPLWAVLGNVIPNYLGWFISLPALSFVLVRWLKKRQRTHPNLPLSQTYLWGSALFVAAWTLPSLLTFIVDLFKDPENAFLVVGDIFGNLHFFLLPLLILCGVAFLVIFIAIQTFLKAPVDSLPAEDVEVNS